MAGFHCSSVLTRAGWSSHIPTCHQLLSYQNGWNNSSSDPFLAVAHLLLWKQQFSLYGAAFAAPRQNKKGKKKDDEKHNSFSCQCTSALVLFPVSGSFCPWSSAVRVGQRGDSRTPQLGPICSAPVLAFACLCSLHHCRGHGDRPHMRRCL